MCITGIGIICGIMAGWAPAGTATFTVLGSGEDPQLGSGGAPTDFKGDRKKMKNP